MKINWKKISTILKEHPGPYYIIMLFIGTVIILLLSLNNNGYEHHFYIPKLWESTLANIGAGIILVPVIYFTKEIFRSTKGQISFSQVAKIGEKVNEIHDEIVSKNKKNVASTLFYLDEKHIREEINSIIHAAQESIEIIDIGYPCHESKSMRSAEEFSLLLKEVLKRGVSVRYHIFLHAASIRWLEHLRRLKLDNSNNLNIFLLHEGNDLSSNNILNINSITPEIVYIIDSNRVEKVRCGIINTEYSRESKLKVLKFQYGIFFYGKKEISDSIREKYMSIFGKKENATSLHQISEKIKSQREILREKFDIYIKERGSKLYNLTINEGNIQDICNTLLTYEVSLMKQWLQYSLIDLYAQKREDRVLLFVYDNRMSAAEMMNYDASLICIASLGDYELVQVSAPSPLVVAKSSPGKIIWGYIYGMNERKMDILENEIKGECSIIEKKTNPVHPVLKNPNGINTLNVNLFVLTSRGDVVRKSKKLFSQNYKERISESTRKELVEFFAEEERDQINAHFTKLRKMLQIK